MRAIPIAPGRRADLGLLPLFLGLSERPQEGQPRHLPFVLAEDETGLVRQEVHPETASILEAGYRQGLLLSTPPGVSGYAGGRTEELVAGLRAAHPLRPGTRVLEIGCGPGHVLARLAREHGVAATGCDPGPAGDDGLDHPAIRRVRAAFRPGDFAGESFDVVFSSMVLEHVSEPANFLAAQWELVSPGGVLFAAVPDCEGQLRTGDLNLPCHQHQSYFTRASLESLFRAAGAASVRFEPASHTLALQAWARRGDLEAAPATGSEAPVPLAAFASRFRRTITRLGHRAAHLRGRRLALSGISIGASVIAGLVDLSGVEVLLLDNDPAKIGRHLAGIPGPVRPDSALAAETVDEVWVLPTLRGPVIARSLALDLGIPRERIVVVASSEC